MPEKKPTPILILGMHRSGTSCLAGTLQQAGVYLGDVSVYNKYNKKGNRENSSTMSLNEKILEYNKASWDTPPETLEWNDSLEEEGKDIIQDFEKKCHSSHWGFKDPRVLLTLPFWNKLLPNASFIGTFRHPMNVAKSLNNRNNSSIEIHSGLSLWSAYNKNLLNFYKELPFPLISFDLPSKEYNTKLIQICSTLNLDNDISEVDFFDKGMRSHKEIINSNEIRPEIMETYSELNRISSAQ